MNAHKNYAGDLTLTVELEKEQSSGELDPRNQRVLKLT